MRLRAVRILYVLRDAEPGPDTALLAGALRHLVREDIEPAVAFLADGPLAGPWREDFGIPVTVGAAAGAAPGRAALVRAVAAAIRDTGAQVVHAIGSAAALVGGPAARQAAVPHVWSQTGLPGWSRAREVRAAFLPSRAIVVHTAAAELAQHRLNPRRQPCRRVTAGVVLPERLREHRRADARQALGLPVDAVVVSSMGPLTDPGHELFLRAATSLCNARSHARLLIAGTDGRPGADALRRRAAALGLGEKLVVLDPADLGRALDAADIALHPSRDAQVLPVALLQAMASGTAVIAFEQPLAREITTHAVDALLTPGTDAEALAVALLSLTDDAPRRLALAAGAAEAARIRHDAAVMAADLTVLYHDVLQP